MKPNPGADLRDVSNQHEMGQWVGITGGKCDDPLGGALLQAGTDSVVCGICYVVLSLRRNCFLRHTSSCRGKIAWLANKKMAIFHS